MTMTRETTRDAYFSTPDLSLAGVILLSHPLEAIERQTSRKAQFLFKDDAKLKEVVNGYWRGELQVEPQAYYNAIRTIKARLYAEE